MHSSLETTVHKRISRRGRISEKGSNKKSIIVANNNLIRFFSWLVWKEINKKFLFFSWSISRVNANTRHRFMERYKSAWAQYWRRRPPPISLLIFIPFFPVKYDDQTLLLLFATFVVQILDRFFQVQQQQSSTGSYFCDLIRYLHLSFGPGVVVGLGPVVSTDLTRSDKSSIPCCIRWIKRKGWKPKWRHLPDSLVVIRVVRLFLDSDPGTRRDLTHFIGDGARVDAGVAPGRGARHDQRHRTVRVQSHVVLTTRTKADPVPMPLNSQVKNKSINQVFFPRLLS